MVVGVASYYGRRSTGLPAHMFIDQEAESGKRQFALVCSLMPAKHLVEFNGLFQLIRYSLR